MSDSADDLILKMQHLEAAAREAQRAHVGEDRFASLKTRAQKMAAEAQVAVEEAERDRALGEESQVKARTPGLPPLEAAELLTAGRAQEQEAKTRLVKARARLNFALDQMDEAERGEWETLQAQARAEAHAQLAESGDDGSGAPVLAAVPPPGTTSGQG
jgi:hypothetical protein